MEQQEANNESVKKQVNIKIKDENRTGVYSNAVTVNVNQNDVVLDFGYIVPGMTPMTIDVVSRVTMGHRTAEHFMKILQDSLLDYRNAVKKNEGN
jgi:hypothetical protein